MYEEGLCDEEEALHEADEKVCVTFDHVCVCTVHSNDIANDTCRRA
jgi:hypothetical protein